MHRVLVTGGAGYIGSHCCKAIRAAGFEPVVFDNLSTGHRMFCRWGPLLVGDIRSADDLDRAFQSVRPIAVMHFAAQSVVPQSVSSPSETFDVNVSGTLALLHAAATYNVQSVVMSSTCAVYGLPDRLPIDENVALNPISPYGASKAMAERILCDFEAAYGMRSVRLRYFNAAGADSDSGIGEWHEPETHLIPTVLDVALGLRPFLPVHGTDYDSSDGTAVRDYIHVEDLADAHVAALRHLVDGGPSMAVNVGTGQGATVGEVVRHVEAETGRKVRAVYGPRRAGDAPYLVANPTKAQHELNWSAKHGLETIVRDAWRWHNELRQNETLVA